MTNPMLDYIKQRNELSYPWIDWSIFSKKMADKNGVSRYASINRYMNFSSMKMSPLEIGHLTEKVNPIWQSKWYVTAEKQEAQYWKIEIILIIFDKRKKWTYKVGLLLSQRDMRCKHSFQCGLLSDRTSSIDRKVKLKN